MIKNLHKVVHSIENDWCDKINVLVVGDVMLDKYVWGDVERISPEAPVPVVCASRRTEQPGGAANVAMNIVNLGGKVTLVGFAGGDRDQTSLENILRAAGVTSRLVPVDCIPTISKLRIFGGNQQMLRLDQERKDSLSQVPHDRLLANIMDELSSASVVILSDYAKGVLTEEVCAQIIRAARQTGIPVLVDPKSKDFRRYRGATTICPNLNELALALGGIVSDMEEMLAQAQARIPELGLEYLIVTLSEKGIALLQRNRRIIVPAVARQVFDVSGAGDTVIATLALCVASGLETETAIQLANVAAGIVVSKVGTAPVHRFELLGALSAEIALTANAKVLTMEGLLNRVSSWRSLGQTIVLTNGCYDLLHVGHLALLQGAKHEGDRLIVAVNSDRSVRELKGSQRPVVGERERAEILAALTVVDAVAIFDELTPLKIIEALRPDVLVKGGDYSEGTVVGAREVKSWGGRVKLIPLVEGLSTTQLIAKANGNGHDLSNRAPLAKGISV